MRAIFSFIGTFVCCSLLAASAMAQTNRPQTTMPRIEQPKTTVPSTIKSKQQNGLSDVGNQQQLKLDPQPSMDRKQKAQAATSNLSKKNSETQNNIIGNMK